MKGELIVRTTSDQYSMPITLKGTHKDFKEEIIEKARIYVGYWTFCDLQECIFLLEHTDKAGKITCLENMDITDECQS